MKHKELERERERVFLPYAFFNMESKMSAKSCPAHDIKLHVMMRLQFWGSEKV